MLLPIQKWTSNLPYPLLNVSRPKPSEHDDERDAGREPARVARGGDAERGARLVLARGDFAQGVDGRLDLRHPARDVAVGRRAAAVEVAERLDERGVRGPDGGADVGDLVDLVAPQRDDEAAGPAPAVVLLVDL